MPKSAGYSRLAGLTGAVGVAMVTSGETGELVRAAGSGDRQAWDQLVDRFSTLLWSIAMAYRLSRPDAADVVQTVWLRLLENLDKLRDPDRVGAWLATTARRECQRALAQSRRVLPTDDDRRLEPRESLEPTPEEVAVMSERDRLLWAAHLSESCRRLLRILVVAAPPYEEVAAALGMPIGSIGPTRARCLERLRRRLSGSGISVDVGDS
jgi:RNA polymerase sigma factor (sigma-70 family)